MTCPYCNVEIAAHPAGTCLDRLCAEGMGWPCADFSLVYVAMAEHTSYAFGVDPAEQCFNPNATERVFVCRVEDDDTDSQPWSPSTSEADAAEVREWLVERGDGPRVLIRCGRYVDGRHWYEIDLVGTNRNDWVEAVRADTLPLAIARAFAEWHLGRAK